MIIKTKEDLIKVIEGMAEELKSRAEDISVDFDKRIGKIEITCKISHDEIPVWEVTKYITK